MHGIMLTKKGDYCIVSGMTFVSSVERERRFKDEFPALELAEGQ
jgi:hypothetical protein